MLNIVIRIYINRILAWNRVIEERLSERTIYQYVGNKENQTYQYVGKNNSPICGWKRESK